MGQSGGSSGTLSHKSSPIMQEKGKNNLKTISLSADKETCKIISNAGVKRFHKFWSSRFLVPFLFFLSLQAAIPPPLTESFTFPSRHHD